MTMIYYELPEMLHDINRIISLSGYSQLSLKTMVSSNKVVSYSRNNEKQVIKDRFNFQRNPNDEPDLSDFSGRVFVILHGDSYPFRTCKISDFAILRSLHKAYNVKLIEVNLDNIPSELKYEYLEAISLL